MKAKLDRLSEDLHILRGALEEWQMYANERKFKRVMKAARERIAEQEAIIARWQERREEAPARVAKCLEAISRLETEYALEKYGPSLRRLQKLEKGIADANADATDDTN